MSRAIPKNKTPGRKIREMKNEMASLAPNLLKELKPKKKATYVGKDEKMTARAVLKDTDGNLKSVSTVKNTHMIKRAEMHSKVISYAETIYDPKYCDIIQDLGREGYNSLEMMSYLNISSSTWHVWLEKYEEFAKAYSVAKVHSGASHYTKIRLANSMFLIAKHKYLLESPFLALKEDETNKIDANVRVDFSEFKTPIEMPKIEDIDGIEVSD